MRHLPMLMEVIIFVHSLVWILVFLLNRRVFFAAKFVEEVGWHENVEEGDHPEDAWIQSREGPQELCPEYTPLYFEITITGLKTRYVFVNVINYLNDNICNATYYDYPLRYNINDYKLTITC